MPEGSTVHIDCTTALSSVTPYWSIDLAGDTASTHYQFSTRKSILNSYGVYELASIGTPRVSPTLTLRLKINNTAQNNGTVVYCESGDGQRYKTTLFIICESLIIINYSLKCTLLC